MTKTIHIHIHSAKTTDAWEESKHPRADNGQFGKGGGGAKASAKPAAKSAPTAKPAIAVKQANRGSSALAQLQAQSNAHLKKTGFGHLVTPPKNAPGTGAPRPVTATSASVSPKLTESDLGKAAADQEAQSPEHLKKNPMRSHYHKQAASRYTKAAELLVEARKAWAKGSEKQYHELHAEAKRLHESGMKNAAMALTAEPTKGMNPNVPSHRGEYAVPASIKRNS